MNFTTATAFEVIEWVTHSPPMRYAPRPGPKTRYLRFTHNSKRIADQLECLRANGYVQRVDTTASQE